MKNEELYWMSACEMAAAVRSKKVSPVEIVKETLERIFVINPQINAFVTIDADSAMESAKKAESAIIKGDPLGPLHGVPISVKDLSFTRGLRTSMGSRLMENFIPNEDAVHVARLRSAGAIILGKTNTPEFGSKAVTDNLVFGISRNPWSLERTPGGSSGGSAAAVAAGLGPLATGSDGGGSIRIPASCCGVFGIKPQFGRVPSYPLSHLLETMSSEGAITRTVRDAALMLDVMSGPHWGDRHCLPLPDRKFSDSIKGDVKGLRVAWSPDLGYASVSKEVKAICEQAAKKFSEMGAEVEEASPKFSNPESSYMKIFGAGLAAMLTTLGPIKELTQKLQPSLIERMRALGDLTAMDYLRATFERQELSARVGEFFQRYDLLLAPVTGVPAWRLDLPTGYVEEIDGQPVSTVGWVLTYPFNFTGQPAASIPAGWTADGLPVGLQMISRYHDEATLFRAAAAFEQEQPWIFKKPNLIDP